MARINQNQVIRDTEHQINDTSVILNNSMQCFVDCEYYYYSKIVSRKIGLAWYLRLGDRVPYWWNITSRLSMHECFNKIVSLCLKVMHLEEKRKFFDEFTADRSFITFLLKRRLLIYSIIVLGSVSNNGLSL